MPLTARTIVEVLAAAGVLGLGLPALVWVLRRVPVRRRALLAVAAWLPVEVLARAACPGAPVVAALAPACPPLGLARFLLALLAGLQLIELVVWKGIIHRWLRIDLPRLLVDLLNFLALAIAAVLVASRLTQHTIRLSDVLVTSTVVSAVIGLALQEVLGNVLAGLSLQTEEPFRVGDWVMVSDQEGQIVQMGWRTTTIRTRDNHYVTIPNGQVARREMINFAKPTRLQAINVRIGVSYADPPARVKEALAAAASDVAGVRRMPAPVVFVEGFGDFAVDYRLKYWITDYARVPELKDAVLTNVFYRLRRQGMTIPFPVRDVTLRRAPGEDAADDSREMVAAALAAVPLFAPLTDDQLAAVAAGSRLAAYAPGEAIVRQGEAGDSLFVVRSGTVAVEVAPEPGDTPVRVAIRSGGDFFGEMSLLTGEERTATVRSRDEVQVVVVDKAAVAGVLLEDPKIVERLSVAVALRRDATAESLAAHEAKAAVRRGASRPLADRIRAFFGLEEGHVSGPGR
ncbi:MAG: mechanosensitive ion channel domain-containing protein [Anaerolineae bacterium]